MERRKEEEREENGSKLPEDLEKGGRVGVLPEQAMERDIKNTNNQGDMHAAMLHRLNPTNPLRIILNGGVRVATPSPQPSSSGPSGHHRHQHHQSPVPRSISTPQVKPISHLIVLILISVEFLPLFCCCQTATCSD